MLTPSLYIPTHIPTLPADWETQWSNLSFPQLSFEILSLFIPRSVIPESDLRGIIEQSYATFRSDLTTPLRQTGEKEWVLELWHGPTWAFKDVALQFLGNLFAYFLQRRNAKGADEALTVVGATSGDTGSYVPPHPHFSQAGAESQGCHLRSTVQTVHHHLHPLPRRTHLSHPARTNGHCTRRQRVLRRRGRLRL